MHSAAPTITMAVLGLIFMVQLSMTASDDSRQVAVFVPPWALGGMPFAARLNAPIIDMRWQGHVIILDVSQDPGAVDRLRNRGMFLMETTLRSGCTTDEAA